MKMTRGKHKRGERGSTEDESNSAKKPNMDATECASDKDGGEGDEESEVQFYETVPEQEPSLKDIKDMLLSVQTTLKDIQFENRKLASEVANLKSSFGFQEQQLNSLKVSLSEATKANDVMKLALQALRKKVNDHKSEINELYESQDDLEQYTHKNSLEELPEDLYTSTEDVVIKLGEVINVLIQSEDIDISHQLYSGKNKPKNIMVKFISRKKKTARYKKRTELKNVRITQLFPHSTTAMALATERLYLNQNRTSFRKDLMEEANQMRKDELLISVWSMDSKIFVKTLPDGAPKRINSQEDLDNL